MLIDAKCDVNIRNSNGQTALFQAVSNNVTCMHPAERLLTAGADPDIQDEQGSTALHKLVYLQEKKPANTPNLLLKHGADINISDKAGRTPLLPAACDSAGIEILQAFLDAGADPAATDNYGNTLLHLAAENSKKGAVGRVRIVLSVISALNHRNEYGKTALDQALGRNTSKVVHELEQAGAKASP
ncbi:MAG: ankyrin repeat domain-containing protein [Desulfosarcina sp.]|nr:ankyrin repeat domain-containing protein [Desulfobacterales bacterium]